jgi:UDP-glucose 4-epimerase
MAANPASTGAAIRELGFGPVHLAELLMRQPREVVRTVGFVRLCVTGMGGELGTRVVQLLEVAFPRADILGMDIDPPRRRLRRAEFVRVHPAERERLVAAIRGFDPTVMVHLGVYEPGARASDTSAARRNQLGSAAALGAAAECPSLTGIVVRSGIEIYGRGRGAPQLPDVESPCRPTTPFGADQLAIEDIAVECGRLADVPVTRLRFAPLVGPHFPSPLGRVLRLPVVPVHVSDPAFSLVHTEDACRAVVGAVGALPDAALNVVALGATTMFQSVRLGNRLPLPVIGPATRVAGALAGVAGAPMPTHLVELVRRGRCADISDLASAIGVTLENDTVDVVKALFEWATVVQLAPGVHAA